MKRIQIYRCGSVPKPLFDALIIYLSSYIEKNFSYGEFLPFIELKEIQDPIIKNINSNENVQAFTKLSNQLDISPIRIIITSLPLWDADPSPLMLFALRILPGTVVFSTFRFTVPDYVKMQERLSKEMVKVLGMALHMDRCEKNGCVLDFHNTPEDLDRSFGMCQPCQARCKELLNRIFT